IRVSLTPEPGGDRTQEVIVAQEILQAMGLRAFAPLVVACPGCGRTTSSYFQELAQSIQSHIRTRMPQWRREYAGVEDMTVAVMGCVVNGPGESRLANIGISLPGTGERAVAPVYEDGEKTVTLKGERIAEEFQELRERARAHRQRRGPPPGPRGRLQLLPRHFHHPRDPRALGERLRVRGQGGPDPVELTHASRPSAPSSHAPLVPLPAAALVPDPFFELTKSLWLEPARAYATDLV